MRLDNITDDNFLDFAIRSYTNLRCRGMEEFYEDLLHIKYLKRLLRKYLETGEMDASRIRLALNHIIILYNVFKIEAATRMLFLRLEPPLYPTLKAFLIHLNFMPAIVHGVNGQDIHSKSFEVDKTILDKLSQV